MTASTSNYSKYQTKNPVMQAVIRRFVDRIVATSQTLGRSAWSTSVAEKE